MLVKILQILASKERSLTFAQLAEKVGQSERELIGIFKQLEHMGYIKHDELGQICSSGCNEHREAKHCQGCSFAETEQHAFSWDLTPKGEKLIHNS